MTAREFLLKRFPTNKYFDCPVPKQYWEIMEEYAKEYHEGEVKKLNEPAVSKCEAFEREALLKAFYLYIDDKWAMGMLTDKVDKVIEGFKSL